MSVPKMSRSGSVPRTRVLPDLRPARIALLCAFALCACEREAPPSTEPAAVRPAPPTEEKALNLYIWNDYLAPDTVAGFEKETGIQVSVTNYASNEELEGKLAAGHSGYDVVVPSASFYQRQIRAGLYRKIDKSKLPNLSNLDPQLVQLMALQDPGNDHAVLHMWGTYGMGYNVDKVKAAAPGAPLDSWKLGFDPATARKLQKCGIAMLESPAEMFRVALNAIGKDPNTTDPADIEAAAAALMKIRPYLRYVQTDRIIGDLANGEICLAIGYLGDFLQARDRAAESHTGQKIAYVVPKDGSILWFDSYLIPKDAPHPGNAHAFIDYMLRPQVIASVTNAIHYANGNVKATSLVDPTVRDDPGVYPPSETRAKLVPALADSPQNARLMTRLWTKFMTGR